MKIQWEPVHRRPGIWLQVNREYWDRLQEGTVQYGIAHQLDEIGRWCIEVGCGKRMAFDSFQFRNKKELSGFLLKWG